MKCLLATENSSFSGHSTSIKISFCQGISFYSKSLSKRKIDVCSGRASRKELLDRHKWYTTNSCEGTFINVHVLDCISMCSYAHVCVHMHVIYPFPPGERHGVSVYESVSACSLTAYKFPWFPFGITTTPLLNNLCFTQPLSAPLVSLQKPNLSLIWAQLARLLINPRSLPQPLQITIL